MFVCLETFDFSNYSCLQLQIQTSYHCHSAIIEWFLCCWLSAIVKKTLAPSLPPPNKLHVNIISSHPSPCYTQQSTNISAIIFAPDNLSPNQVFASRLSLNSLLWKIVRQWDSFMSQLSIVSFLQSLSLKNVLNGCEHHRRVCVCVHKSEKFGSDGRTSHSWACYSSVDRPACLDCWPVTDLHNFNSLSAKSCWHWQRKIFLEIFTTLW